MTGRKRDADDGDQNGDHQRGERQRDIIADRQSWIIGEFRHEMRGPDAATEHAAGDCRQDRELAASPRLPSAPQQTGGRQAGKEAHGAGKDDQSKVVLFREAPVDSPHGP